MFHELARHVQTRRLIAGDSLSLDQDKSFYCVMDGTVQVFAKVGSQGDEWTQWEGEDMNGYQLLNEVGGGSTLSSLFTILSLFTEDVKIAWEEAKPDISMDDDIPQFELGGGGGGSAPASASYELVHVQRNRHQRSLSHSLSISSEGSTVHPIVTEPPEDGPGSWQPPRQVGPPSRPETPTAKRRPHLPARSISQLNHGTIARATVDSTLAVIPAEAFRRLTKKFPKASGHIVQGNELRCIVYASLTALSVILTRFSRVTFHAAHKYLGLTSELLRTEKAINELACHPLPDEFYTRGGLQTLRHRLDAPAEAALDDSDDDYFGDLPEPSTSSTPANLRAGTKTPSAGRARVFDSQDLIESPVKQTPPPFTPYKSHGSRHAMNAGDLLTMTGHASAPYLPSNHPASVVHSGSIKGGRKVSQHAPASTTVAPGDIEFNLRDEVMGCIAKSIGLVQPPIGSDSAETDPDMVNSPGVFSMKSGASSISEHQRNKPLFNASFGGLHDDSMSSLAGMSSGNDSLYPSGLDNDIEILFFTAGSTLVTAGEKNGGKALVLLTIGCG